MAHPDDKIVSPRAVGHGPPGGGKGKSTGGHKARQDKSHTPGGDDDEDDDMTSYAGLKFPPFEYKEFPKWVTHPISGVPKNCHSASEELEYLQTEVNGRREPPPMEKERDALAQEVAQLRAQLTLQQQKDAKAAASTKPGGKV